MKLLQRFTEDVLHLDWKKYSEQFNEYNSLLLEWNKKINLISRKSESTEEHILNSIFFLQKYDLHKITTLADIGTGGGLPGIPLKILFPEMEVVMIDSIQKKIMVLNDIIDRMKLEKTTAVCGRSEILAEDKIYNKKYEAVISKSVGTLTNVYLWSRGLLKKKGRVLCIKGGDIITEIEELNKLKYNLKTEVINFDYEPEFKIEDKKLVVINNN
ncbi:MAG: 16S rRNA (guanine(527)-N(7))-methyltransferase RsmG [bacterium]